MILLNPGPVNLTAGVRAALAGPDLCHREPEFGALLQSVRGALADVYALDPAQWSVVMLAGSGTAAVEAMLSSLVPRDARVLVIANGVYGERMASIAAVHGIAHHVLTYPWGAPFHLADVEHAFATHSDISHVAVVHHETTTGRLNDLTELGALCLARDVGLLVDAVSSFGAEALDLEAWNSTACAATAGKCLHGAPGLSFVIAQRGALANPELLRRTVYLDLPACAREQDAGSAPFTLPVHLFHALARALDEMQAAGGWRARHARYRQLAEAVRERLQALGVEPFLPATESSVALRAYRLPAHIDYGALHDRLKARGFVIYAGQGGLANRIFRISTMGDIGDDDLARLLRALAEVV